MSITTCSHPDCREPHGRAVYVFMDGSQKVYCLYCFLVQIIELDDEDALTIEEEAELTNSLYDLRQPSNS